MRTEEINATIGIDIESASNEQIIKRSIEFCAEMADCYEANSLEASAFYSLRSALCRLTGEATHDS